MKRRERAKNYNETIRELAIAKLGGACVKCGSSKDLHIHHKDNDVRNHDESNLELLCAKCHGKEHGTVFNSCREGGERVRTTIYTSRSVIEQFKEICIRESESMSKKIGKWIQRYNEGHTPGNPQLKISVYAEPEEQQPMSVLCLFIDGALSNGQVHCRRAGMWIPGIQCYSCPKNQLRKQP